MIACIRYNHKKEYIYIVIFYAYNYIYNVKFNLLIFDY